MQKRLQTREMQRKGLFGKPSVICRHAGQRHSKNVD